MPELVRLPAETPVDQVMHVMRRNGAVILTGMMSGAETKALTDELMPYLETTKPGRESFSGFKTTRTGALAARSAKVRAAIMDTRVRAICDQVLLPNCDRYQVNVTHVIRIMPGEVAQVMHRDRWSWAYLKEIEPQLKTIWALSGDHAGAPFTAPSSVKRVTCFDSTSIKYKSGAPSRSEAKAIKRPSGDHAGEFSFVGLLVRLV